MARRNIEKGEFVGFLSVVHLCNFDRVSGVAEGDTISVVPSRVKGKGAAAKSAAAAAASVADEDSDDDLIDPALAGAGAAGRSAVRFAGRAQWTRAPLLILLAGILVSAPKWGVIA